MIINRFVGRQLLLMMFMALVLNVGAQSPSGKYFVIFKANPARSEIPKSEDEALQAAHLFHTDSLIKVRRLLASGSFHGGGGMIVLAAVSLDEAQTIVNKDPIVAAGRMVAEIFPFSMNIGGICPTPEKYEMAEYQFIRYIPVSEAMAGQTEKKLEKLGKRHSSYLKVNFYERSLIADTDFGPGKGGVLIAFNADADEFDRFMQYDPFVKSGLYKPVSSTLWIAQGTFCERKPEPKKNSQPR